MYYSIRPLPASDLPLLLDSSVLLAWLRADESEEATAYRLLRSAMSYAEGVAGQPLFEREFTVELTDFNGGFLPGVNPREVTIEYMDWDANIHFWGADEDADVKDAFRVRNGGRVVFSPTRPAFDPFGNYQIRYTAGYAPAEVPADIIDALLLLIADRYDNRSNGVSERMTTADRLLQPYKIYTV